MRVCVFQPVVPRYRTAFFNKLGATEDIELTVAAGRSAPGSPASDDPERFTHFTWHEAPVLKVGPLLSQPAQIEGLRDSAFEVIVLGWNVRYVQTNLRLMLAKTLSPATRILAWGHATAPGETRLRRSYRDWLGKRADAVVVYDDATADSLTRRGFSHESVFVAPNALDAHEAVEAAAMWHPNLGHFQDRHGIGDRPVLLFVARLTRGKKLDLLLEALVVLVDRQPDTLLVVVGDGPLLDEARSWVKNHGLSSHVRFVGAVYEEVELAPWFLVAAALVIPSAVGLSALHAFSYGLPVVTSQDPRAHGPEHNVIRDRENGLLFKDDDPADLARVLEALLGDAPLQSSLAAGARVAATGRHTLANMVDGMRDAIFG